MVDGAPPPTGPPVATPGPPPGPVPAASPSRRRWLIPGAAVVVVVALVAVVVIVAGNDGGNDAAKSTGPGEVFGPAPTTASGGSVGTTGSFSAAKLTLADLPPGYEEVEGFAALPIATCAGAVDRVDSTKSDSILASFKKGNDGPAVTQSMLRYSRGAEAEYSLLARGIADCRARASSSNSSVLEASALELPAVGDERSGARVLMGNPNNRSDPGVPLEMATARIGDVTLTITVSAISGTIDPGLTAGLLSKAASRLR